jgi:hypothetical protein
MACSPRTGTSRSEETLQTCSRCGGRHAVTFRVIARSLLIVARPGDKNPLCLKCGSAVVNSTRLPVKPVVPDIWIDLEEASAITRCTPKTIRKWIKAGKIRTRDDGPSTLLSLRDLLPERRPSA